tara:strand:+ start:68923 stop:70176 length:1254 start_codon:yes stop_codon:yes gene_type:complete
MNHANHRVLFAFCLTVCLGGAPASAQPAVRPGDRVAIVGNTFADQLRIHGYLETLLLQYSHDNPISIRNLGWGGDMLTARDRPTNFPTEESTLRSHETDVIIACFGMGESFAGKKGLDDFKQDLDGFVNAHAGKSYNGRSAVRLVLVSPIAHEDLGHLTPARTQRNLDLGMYRQAMLEVASQHSVPFIDLFEPSRYLMDESVGPSLTTNGIHLNPYGYWAISRTFFENLVADEGAASETPWHIFVDATSSTSESRGVELSDMTKVGAAIEFTVREVHGPTPAPPINATLPPPLQHQRDTLSVSNLPAGQYTLFVDGKSVVTADSEAWANGVPVDASPSHQHAESLRRAINDKNLQFTYSWKALNQVHIVGERRTSPSGRALPAEVIEFNRIADQRDQELRAHVQPQTRRWRIAPAKG